MLTQLPTPSNRHHLDIVDSSEHKARRFLPQDRAHVASHGHKGCQCVMRRKYEYAIARYGGVNNLGVT